MPPKIQAAIQAAAIAEEYELAAEMAKFVDADVCLHCGRSKTPRTKPVLVIAPAPNRSVRDPIGWMHTRCAQQVARRLGREIVE